MELNQVIPLTTSEGHQYLIEFSEIKDSVIPNAIGVSIINVVIAAENDINTINNAGTLFVMSNILFDYLQKFDVVLYFYCDREEIKKSEKKKAMPPQQYRSHLFSSMFDRKSIGCNLINRIIVIEDKTYGDHYIHLISRETNSGSIEILSEELKTFNK